MMQRFSEVKSGLAQNPNAKFDTDRHTELIDSYILLKSEEKQPCIQSATGLQNTPKMISDLGLGNDITFTKQVVRAKTDPENPKMVEDVQENYFSDTTKDHHILVSVRARMKKLVKGKDDPVDIGLPGQTMFWNEVFKIAADHAMKEGYLAKAGYLFRDAVVNQRTMEAIDYIRNAVPPRDGKPYTRLDVSSNDPTMSDAVDYILGTRNTKGLPHLLIDFPDSMGRQAISEIYLWHSNEQYSLAFKLAPF